MMVFLRAIPWLLSGIGLADIANDWFRGRKSGQAVDIGAKVKSNILLWVLSAAAGAVMLSQFSGLLKRR